MNRYTEESALIAQGFNPEEGLDTLRDAGLVAVCLGCASVIVGATREEARAWSDSIDWENAPDCCPDADRVTY